MDTKLLVAKKVEECYQEAERYFSRSLVRPKLGFDIRGQDAGRAYFFGKQASFLKKKSEERRELKFNEILMDENPQVFLEQIVPHECAHLIVYEIFGTQAKPHGPEWKGLMERVFEADASTRHNLDVSRVSNKPYIYSCRCPGREIALSSRQHKSIQKGSDYQCRECKGLLVFLHETEIKSSKKNAMGGMTGLYLYIADDIVLDQVLLGRMSLVLGKKKPKLVLSSRDLSKIGLFAEWLRSRTIFRRYKGELPLSELKGQLESGEISHCIHFGLIDQGEEYWNELVEMGLVLRTIKLR